ncbi:MAG: nucleoside triphosphate pyrophosphohydrolase [Pyrinomonadaceae bacterium]
MSASFQDLVSLMARLRSTEGCPWDREQTYRTLAPMLLEEAYETCEAVEDALEGRPEELRDELGDLLFQIVFYAQIAHERGEFAIDDVTGAVHTKMVRRHPHIFGDRVARDSAEVRRNWDEIKVAEKRDASADRSAPTSLLDDVSKKTPALMEARQLSAKAAGVGFDWQHLEDILAKLYEEVGELRVAVQEAGARSDGDEPDALRVRDEVGDLLFVITNIARHLKVDPEAALKATNRKFRRRFSYIEQKFAALDKEISQATLDEMEALWQEAKRQDK